MTPADNSSRLRRHGPYLGVAALVVGVALVTLRDAAGLDVEVSYSGIGPDDFPRIVAVGGLILGAIFAVAAFRSGAPALPALNVRPLLWILGGLLGQILALPYLGFSISTAILFACTSVAFGQKSLAISFLVGMILAVTIFLFFAVGLDLSLPIGPVERLLR